MVAATLCGITDPNEIPRSICAMGHKWMWNPKWGGLPPEEFLTAVDPLLAGVRDKIAGHYNTSDKIAGHLSPKWAEALGLSAGIPIPDRRLRRPLGRPRRQHPPRRRRQRHRHLHLHHRPQRQANPGPRRLRRRPRLGRSRSRSASKPACPQSATSSPPSPARAGTTVAELSEAGAHLKAGQTGLLRLTWDNGDRTVLVNPALGGVTFGWNLHHTAADELHAAVEGSALHTRVIFNRMEENGAPINRVINGGGIPKKNAKLNQIYANVLRKPVLVPEGDVTSLGSVIIAFLAAGDFKSIEEAQDALCPPLQDLYARAHRGRPLRSPLQALPRCLLCAGHGRRQPASLGHILPELQAIRREATAAAE